MFVRDLSVLLGYELASFVPQTNPICGTCVNFNGQFVGANIEAVAGSNWGELSSRSILWSVIGTFELDPEVNIGAGYMTSIGSWPVRQNVHAYKLMQLGNRLACYTDAGIVLLSPYSVNSVFAYEHKRHGGVGVLSGNHVAGDNTVHGFIDTHGEFWILTGDANLTRRGYREFIRAMVDFTSTSDTRTIVSYIPHEQTFYISNGNECLVINRYGAYKTHQAVASSVQVQNGAISGTFITGTDTEARLTCDTLDFGSRGVKSIEALLADASHPSSTTMTLSTDWRMAKSAAFGSQRWIASGPIGRAVIRTAALEFRPRVRFSSFVDAELMGILANVKYSDQRFKRGTVPAQYEVGVA